MSDLREAVMTAVASQYGSCSNVSADAIIAELYDEHVWLVEDSFMGLVKVAQAMLDEHYPADVFVGRDSVDSGVRFVTRLRDALAQVHADTAAFAKSRPSEEDAS